MSPDQREKLVGFAGALANALALAPVNDRQRAETRAAKPLRGGNAPPPAGGLFDECAHAQLDLVEAAAEPIFYATTKLRLRAYEWRLVVRSSRWAAGDRVTQYQWRAADSAEPWKPEEQWPSYNPDDGVFAGCPRSLRKLFDAHEEEIRAALRGALLEHAPDLFA